MLHHLKKQGSRAEFLHLYVTPKPWISGTYSWTLGLAEMQLFYREPQFPMLFSNLLSQLVVNCQARPGVLCSSNSASPDAKPELGLTSSIMCFKDKGYMETILC